MSYFIQIILCNTSGPDSNQGLPSYFLPHTSLTIAHANAAGMDHLTGLGRSLGSAYFNVFNEDGEAV
jgi:hypothetical protein